MGERKKDPMAVELGRRGGLKGGHARAAALTPAELSAIGRKAAAKRWGSHDFQDGMPRATHEGDLSFGDLKIPCYNLPDGRRVLSMRGMVSALGMKFGTNPKHGADRLANFVAGKGISPFVSESLAALIKNSFSFRTVRGAEAFGYEATLLGEICNAVVDAAIAGKLQVQQGHILERCRILQKALVGVAIVALVDEATGYQAERDRDELHQLLEKFIAKESLPWMKRFPDEYYKQLYRLLGWKYPRGTNHPWYIGKATKAIVYKRLPEGVLEALEEKNPADDLGARKTKHHQWLTEEVGSPVLRDHLLKVVAVMQTCDSWDEFRRKLTRISPAPGEQMALLTEGNTYRPDPDLEPPRA